MYFLPLVFGRRFGKWKHPPFFLFLRALGELGPHLAPPHTGPSTSKACDLGLYLTINILKSQDVGHGGFLCLVLKSQRDLTPTLS